VVTSLVLLLVNFTCARDTVSDYAGVAMTSGFYVITSLVVCVIVAGIAAGRARRQNRTPALGCIALVIWLVGMYAVLDLIWTRLARFG